MSYSIEMLSLSKIGRLLKEKLGDDATQYLFPDDFEKAIADIDFKGVVFDGDSAPYDVTIIGKVNHPYLFGANRDTTEIASARYIGINEDEPFSVPTGAFFKCVSITDITLPVNTTNLGVSCFNSCTSLKNINNLSNVITVGDNVFSGCKALTELNFPNLTYVSINFCSSCSSLQRLYLPKVQNFSRNNVISLCTSLEYLQIGSVGCGINTATIGTTTDVTQSTLTVDAYVSASVVSTILTNLRNKLPNATINIIAAQELTYNGATYSAGDTIISSTPS